MVYSYQKFVLLFALEVVSILKANTYVSKDIVTEGNHDKLAIKIRKKIFTLNTDTSLNLRALSTNKNMSDNIKVNDSSSSRNQFYKVTLPFDIKGEKPAIKSTITASISVIKPSPPPVATTSSEATSTLEPVSESTLSSSKPPSIPELTSSTSLSLTPEPTSTPEPSTTSNLVTPTSDPLTLAPMPSYDPNDVFWAFPSPHPSYNDPNWAASVIFPSHKSSLKSIFKKSVISRPTLIR